MTPPPDTAPGLARLQALLTAILAAEDTDAVDLAIAEFVDDTDGQRAVALAQLHDSAAAEVLVSKIRVRLSARKGADLARLLKQRFAEARAEQRDSRRNNSATNEPPPSLRSLLGAPSDCPDYPTPSGYEASPSGIAALVTTKDTIVSVPVCRPCLVAGRRVDLGTGRESLTVAYRRQSGWAIHNAARAELLDAKRVVAFADFGLPVTSANARELVGWLDACESSGGRSLPSTTYTSRLGWHGETFITGPGCGIDLEDPDGDRSGWVTAGTYREWCDGFRAIRHLDVVFLMLYAGCASTLLPFFGLGFCPIVDVWGPSGTGKTTGGKAIASCYARPDEHHGGGIAATWADTTYILELAAERYWHVPFIVDDTAKATRPDEIGPFLYRYAQGRAKGRGKREGGKRQQAMWESVMITTGESPIVSGTEAGGARNRVLSIAAAPFPDRETAQALERVIAVNYGHVGPMLAAAAQRIGPVALRKRFQVALAQWAKHPADTRLLSTCAAMEVTARILHDDLKVPTPSRDPLGPGGLLERSLLASACEADQAERALNAVRDELAARRTQYVGQFPCDRNGIPITPDRVRGVWREHDDFVGLLGSTLEEVLERGGHHRHPVLTRWIERGVVRAGNHGRQNEVKADGHKYRVYVFVKDMLW